MSDIVQDPDTILNVYLWGSRVYGTATPTSDWDFIAVVKDQPKAPDEPVLLLGILSVGNN